MTYRLALLILASLLATRGSIAGGFSTGGHTVYHLRMAKIELGAPKVLTAAAYDGTVLCFSKGGDLIWKKHVTDGLPLDLDVCDLNGDAASDSRCRRRGLDRFAN